MGWNGGRDENNLLQMKCLPNFFYTPEVTQMDGIEGAAEQPNSSSCGLLSYFSTLPI
jgi:hypothetical protein